MFTKNLTSDSFALLHKFKIQTLIKSIARIVCLNALPQALDNRSLIKMKPLEMCLPCLLVLKVAVGFYGEIETIAVTIYYFVAC